MKSYCFLRNILGIAYILAIYVNCKPKNYRYRQPENNQTDNRQIFPHDAGIILSGAEAADFDGRRHSRIKAIDVCTHLCS